MESHFDPPPWSEPDPSDPDQEGPDTPWDDAALGDTDPTAFDQDHDPTSRPDADLDGDVDGPVDDGSDLPYAADVDNGDRAPSFEVDSEPDGTATGDPTEEYTDAADSRTSLVGTDPDLTTVDDTARPALPDLDLDRMPEPADGVPWSDPAALGVVPDQVDAPGSPEDPAGTPVGAAEDLTVAWGEPPSGDEATQWASLRDSDDPAVRALARFWAPVQS